MEHAPTYSQAQAYHALTDGRFKYIWRTLDGSEQLFDLDRDPGEELDLAQNSSFDAMLETWGVNGLSSAWPAVLKDSCSLAPSCQTARISI